MFIFLYTSTSRSPSCSLRMTLSVVSNSLENGSSVISVGLQAYKSSSDWRLIFRPIAEYSRFVTPASRSSSGDFLWRRDFCSTRQQPRTSNATTWDLFGFQKQHQLQLSVAILKFRLFYQSKKPL